MAFDGIVISNIVKELNETLLMGRISKIAQPEVDELMLTVKNNRRQYRLVLSASASLPLIYLTDKNKQAPMTAPNFCMLLRKHISNGKIVEISQPGLERIIFVKIEHLNELGDSCEKILIIEIMGKHSNIIFCDDQNKIIDSIKHISMQTSSIREVLPGRDYFIPVTQEKADPLNLTYEPFKQAIIGSSLSLVKAVYNSYTGISPCVAQELCYRSSIDGDKPGRALNENEILHLFRIFNDMIEDVKRGHFKPNIVYDAKMPVEFSSLHLSMYEKLAVRDFTSISQVLEEFYAVRNTITRMRQKSSDLRRIVQNALERNVKKYDLQLKQLTDTEKKDKYKVYGELINTYGYNLEPEAKSLEALNYYDGKTIRIPLDPALSPQDNAKKYFERYNKLKRTYEALKELIQETKDEITHLESVSTALDIASTDADLSQIKEELTNSGHIKKKYTGQKKSSRSTSKPLHYLSPDGYHIYVGKNNIQNEELTFKFASGNDWWFHAKNAPGSHVILKTTGDELPDSVFEDAGRLAAHYSSQRGMDKIEIDYTLKKNVKKPNGSKPGFVVYYTNYSLVIDSDITELKQIEE